MNLRETLANGAYTSYCVDAIMEEMRKTAPEAGDHSKFALIPLSFFFNPKSGKSKMRTYVQRPAGDDEFSGGGEIIELEVTVVWFGFVQESDPTCVTMFKLAWGYDPVADTMYVSGPLSLQYGTRNTVTGVTVWN